MNFEDMKAQLTAEALVEMILGAAVSLEIGSTRLVTAVMCKLMRAMYDNIGYEETSHIMHIMQKVLDDSHKQNVDAAKKKTDQIIERITK